MVSSYIAATVNGCCYVGIDKMIKTLVYSLLIYSLNGSRNYSSANMAFMSKFKAPLIRNLSLDTAVSLYQWFITEGIYYIQEASNHAGVELESRSISYFSFLSTRSPIHTRHPYIRLNTFQFLKISSLWQIFLTSSLQRFKLFHVPPFTNKYPRVEIRFFCMGFHR